MDGQVQFLINYHKFHTPRPIEVNLDGTSLILPPLSSRTSCQIALEVASDQESEQESELRPKLQELELSSEFYKNIFTSRQVLPRKAMAICYTTAGEYHPKQCPSKVSLGWNYDLTTAKMVTRRCILSFVSPLRVSKLFSSQPLVSRDSSEVKFE